MINDSLLFIGGFTFGSIATLCVSYVVAFAYSRISGRPGPSGESHTMSPLPFSVKDDNAEAAIERAALLPRDHIEGLGR